MIRVVPRSGQEEHTLRAMRSFADSVKAQPGCAAAEILREAAAPGALVYLETWLDELHLEQHVTSRDYDLLLGLVESSAEQPGVEFRFVAETRGLAWVEQLRIREQRRSDETRADAGFVDPPDAPVRARPELAIAPKPGRRT